MPRTDLTEWLNKKVIELMQARGERISLEEIADYLGIKGASFSHYLNGRRVPKDDAVKKIAAKFGDEIYDVLGQPRPDPLLEIVSRRWGLLSEEIREQLAGIVERYAAKEGDGVAELKALDRRLAKVKRR